MNWPVARVLAPFLANAGIVVVSGIRLVLESNDDTWKSSVVNGAVANSKELIVLLQPELKRIANAPTAGERAEGLDQLVTELLESGMTHIHNNSFQRTPPAPLNSARGTK